MQSLTQPAALLEEAKKLQRKIAILLCGLYLVFAAIHPILSPAVARVMSPLALVTAALAGLVAVSSPKIPLAFSHAVNGLYAFLILINSLAHLFLTKRLEESTNVMIVLFAVGVVFYSWRWFWSVLAITVASWLWTTRAFTGTTQWGHYLFALLLSACLAALYHRLRIAGVWQLAQSRYAEVERTFELAESNVELQRAARKLKDQAKELEKQNEILAENVRLKDDVERISRHDLRTPLNSIISLAQIAREDPALPPQHEASLQLIEQAGYRVLNMANLTLDLFKMEQGTYVFTPRSIDLKAIIDRALLDLGALMRTREVTCEVRCEGFVPERAPFVRGDELLAHSMLTNLLKNAVEASEPGDTVGVRIVNGEWVQVRIHNRGVIPEEIRARFFEKYATRGKKGGTGLGAYSASLMAKTQGGHIQVETSAAAGTTMIIELAPGDSEAALEPATGSVTTSMMLASGDWPTRSILVVDDDPNNRAILRHFLSHPRWSVAEAENGPLALQHWKDAAWDFILLDIEMPVMDGFEVVSKLRALERSNEGVARRATIVALSSHDDESVRERSLASGFDLYLSKPVDHRALVELVAGAAITNQITLDPDLKHLIPEFLESKKDEIEHVREALARNDQDFARREFHRLRGSFSLYGFADAAALCAEMEDLARSNRLAVAGQRLPLLHDYLKRVDVKYKGE